AANAPAGGAERRETVAPPQLAFARSPTRRRRRTRGTIPPSASATEKAHPEEDAGLAPTAQPPALPPVANPFPIGPEPEPSSLSKEATPPSSLPLGPPEGG